MAGKKDGVDGPVLYEDRYVFTTSSMGASNPHGAPSITKVVNLTPSGFSIGPSGTNTTEETWGAKTSATDNSSIAHGMSTAPTAVLCTISLAIEICSVTAIDNTNFTVGIRKDDRSSGTSQTTYWRAFR